ncbi:conjugal transfer protein TrbD [Trinickia mobilis]|uniref:conjugal transfer protein TrbD n=1 Tax=Trinickia mobilis TaxID=2816356 RepID=UPI001A8E484D|nr:conjugal transfer protein TrbD [Trinickia mobilis]
MSDQDVLQVRHVHKSLERRITLAGGERELVLFSMLIGVTEGFACSGSFGPQYGVPVGIAIAVALLFVVKRMGRADKRMSKVLIRHFKYRRYYPARGRPNALVPKVRDFR